MKERILGTPGRKRRRRLWLFAPLVLVAVVAVTLVAVSSAPAVNTDGSQYSIQTDDLLANDVPGQKDLTLQGTNTADLPSKINVLWNWDETSVSGKNTLDACTLFDSDNDGNANFSFCATLGNAGSPPSLTLKATTLYTCGDTRNDRCSSQANVVPSPSAATTCTIVTNDPSDPFSTDASYPNDTRAYCTVVLADVGASTAKLLNTCSYPSAEPNSDPSDCVLVPGKSSPSATTAPKLVPQDSAAVSGVATGGTTSGSADGKIVFSLYATGDTSCATPLFTQAIAVTGDGTYKTTNSGDPTSTPAGYTISADGNPYRWKVVYNGDSKNNPFTIACGVEQVIVDITP
jgi:hypothetical protein